MRWSSGTIMALTRAVASMILILQGVDRLLVITCPANPLKTLSDTTDITMLYFSTTDIRNNVQLLTSCVDQALDFVSVNEYIPLV